MKLIHCADLHLGSRLNSVFGVDEAKAKTRREEILNSFASIVYYARDNGINVILLSGDVFDSDRPRKSDKEYFYNIVSENRDIDFLYLKGNHDKKGAYVLYEGLDNLHTFGDSWGKFSKGDVDIYAVELTENNCRSIYSELKTDPERVNIVMLHGAIGSQMDETSINKELLKNKNIDYVALGHYHSYMKERLDARGWYAYSGCPEGRGFDECGEKGFVVLNVENKTVGTEFVRAAKRLLHAVPVDVSECDNVVQAEKKIESSLDHPKDDIIELTVTGEVKFDATGVETRWQDYFNRKFFYVRVRSKLSSPLDVDKLSHELSRRGEFVRTVMEDDSLTDDKKASIIRIGLTMLRGDKDKL